METKVRCPMCEEHTKCNWLGGDSFQCQTCGWYFSSEKDAVYLKKQAAEKAKEIDTCPYCNQPVVWDSENAVVFEKLTRIAHPACIQAQSKEKSNREAIEHKQIALLEKVAAVPCPNCGDTGIYLDDEGQGYYNWFYRPFWMCVHCNTRVDKHWLMAKIKGGTKCTTTQLSKP